MNFVILQKRKKIKILLLSLAQSIKECQLKTRLPWKKEEIRMSLQPQIIILRLTIIELLPIKIKLNFMEFINSLDLPKNISMPQALGKLFVKRLLQSPVYLSRHKHQGPTEQPKKEALIKTIFTINCFSLETNGYKATKSSWRDSKTSDQMKYGEAKL